MIEPTKLKLMIALNVVLAIALGIYTISCIQQKQYDRASLDFVLTLLNISAGNRRYRYLKAKFRRGYESHIKL